jgi:eukaryotic-like serine/threonine-protein kinase
MSEIPRAIGAYAVVRSLGQGSMGMVFEARDPKDGRRLAIKTLSPELARDRDLRERFKRESAVAAGLSHPNIVRVLDRGESNGLPFLAMEYVEGRDLERLVHDRALSLEWSIDVLRQLAEGLAYAHDEGVVHRDVKPANLRLTPSGELKILDFGIARLASSSLTKRGLVLGSVQYMAPEQFEGGPVDRRADVFSVGCVAYELLSGRKPFEGDSLTAVMARITREPPDAAVLPPSAYSPELEALVMKALARRVEDRYPTLRAFRADLLRAVRAAAARTAGGA